MSFFRSIGLISMAATILLAQSPDQTRVKEATLKKSLMILRQAIEKYTLDQHKAPQALPDLIATKHVDSIPADPMTGSNSTWTVVMEDLAKSANHDQPGIQCA